MILGEMLAKFALTEAMNKVRPSLKRMWEELFPPTPLYLAALKEAAKEATISFKSDTGTKPQLDIDKAMGASDWATLDFQKIRALPLASQDNISKQLQEAVEGLDDVSSRQVFVTQVMNAAETKFQRALALDESADPLWKSYIGEIQKVANKNLEEILYRLSELEMVLGARWVKDSASGEVRTLSEMLGPKHSVDEEIVAVLPPASPEIAFISRAEFWDRYQGLWSDWHSLRSGRRLKEAIVRSFETQAPAGGLVPALQAEYMKEKAMLNDIIKSMSQIKSDLFAMAERATQISDREQQI